MVTFAKVKDPWRLDSERVKQTGGNGGPRFLVLDVLDGFGT